MDRFRIFAEEAIADPPPVIIRQEDMCRKRHQRAGDPFGSRKMKQSKILPEFFNPVHGVGIHGAYSQVSESSARSGFAIRVVRINGESEVRKFTGIDLPVLSQCKRILVMAPIQYPATVVLLHLFPPGAKHPRLEVAESIYGKVRIELRFSDPKER
jgi:hypothetical protein